MLNIRSALLGNVGLTAMLSSLIASDIEKVNRAAYGKRPTPRKPERAKPIKRASTRRAAERCRLRALYRRGIRKNREIGINPVYHGHYRDSFVVRDWQAAEREWERRNPAEAA